MGLSRPDQELIKDLLKSEGWKIIGVEMNKRRTAALNALMTVKDLDTLHKLQSQISEIDFLLKAPHQWIK